MILGNIRKYTVHLTTLITSDHHRQAVAHLEVPSSASRAGDDSGEMSSQERYGRCIAFSAKRMQNSTSSVRFHQDVFLHPSFQIYQKFRFDWFQKTGDHASRDPVTPMRHWRNNRSQTDGRSPLQPPPWVAQRSDYLNGSFWAPYRYTRV